VPNVPYYISCLAHRRSETTARISTGANSRRGAALMTLAMACYVLNDGCVKLTTDRLPPGQVLSLRASSPSRPPLPLTRPVPSLSGWLEVPNGQEFKHRGALGRARKAGQKQAQRMQRDS
jgi:hypothetical protein